MSGNASFSESILVMGTMSGTSCDGLDVVLCRIGRQGQPVALLALNSMAYPRAWSERLQKLGSEDLAGVKETEEEWTAWVLKALKSCAAEWQIPHGQPVLLGFSGHTWYHEPGGRGTAAIGDAAALASSLGIPVVADYRSADVAAGGQGAPLVPLFDAHVFGGYAGCINLGGIVNLTLLPSDGGPVKAWDVAGCNLLLNRQARRLGLPYDAGGERAAVGHCVSAALDALNTWPFLAQQPPKSLAAEDLVLLHSVLDGLESGEDGLATGVEWVATTVARDLEAAPNPGRLLLTGGGAHNAFLVQRLDAHMPAGWTVEVPEAMWVDGKEAAAFAWLAWRTVQGLPTALASVTGANMDTCGGEVFGNFAVRGGQSDPRNIEG